MKNEVFDFYDKTSLKSYNLDEKMRYQLNMLDTLDVFTRKHCENVASVTCRLCEYLHCNKGFTEYCTIGAFLHDVGKLYIPAEVLQKPGKLTDEEYEIMKTHTTIGYNMLNKDPKLRPYAHFALSHHEALNGSGYPEGLTKKEIPYEIQIVTVADEFDAIVSKRQYKTHIGISDTLKILIENSQPNAKSRYKEEKKSVALSEMKDLAKMGKINPAIVRVLFKVVVDDIGYEITCRQSYVDDLKAEIDRLHEVEKYDIKREKATNEKKKNYFLEGMKLYLKGEETVDNYKQLLEEYKQAYSTRKAQVDNLYNEMKIIKKLRV
ncbi:MAG: HD domain-containing protein [Clostridia bacterium]|nr:HD domain-containing protein [Clostridia bacterium]